MAVASWAVPVGVLAGICIICFAFIWWWFPRAWQRGVNHEARIVDDQGKDIVDDEERQEARAAYRERAHDIVQKALAAEQARKRGEVVEVGVLERDEHGNPIRPAGFSAV